MGHVAPAQSLPPYSAFVLRISILIGLHSYGHCGGPVNVGHNRVILVCGLYLGTPPPPSGASTQLTADLHQLDSENFMPSRHPGVVMVYGFFFLIGHARDQHISKHQKTTGSHCGHNQMEIKTYTNTHLQGVPKVHWQVVRYVLPIFLLPIFPEQPGIPKRTFYPLATHGCVLFI